MTTPHSKAKQKQIQDKQFVESICNALENISKAVPSKCLNARHQSYDQLVCTGADVVRWLHEREFSDWDVKKLRYKVAAGIAQHF
jgi:hypothetical protein